MALERELLSGCEVEIRFLFCGLFWLNCFSCMFKFFLNDYILAFLRILLVLIFNNRN